MPPLLQLSLPPVLLLSLLLLLLLLLPMLLPPLLLLLLPLLLPPLLLLPPPPLLLLLLLLLLDTLSHKWRATRHQVAPTGRRGGCESVGLGRAPLVGGLRRHDCHRKPPEGNERGWRTTWSLDSLRDVAGFGHAPLRRGSCCPAHG